VRAAGLAAFAVFFPDFFDEELRVDFFLVVMAPPRAFQADLFWFCSDQPIFPLEAQESSAITCGGADLVSDVARVPTARALTDAIAARAGNDGDMKGTAAQNRGPQLAFPALFRSKITIYGNRRVSSGVLEDRLSRRPGEMGASWRP
jgi:hypothetical protein